MYQKDTQWRALNLEVPQDTQLRLIIQPLLSFTEGTTEPLHGIKCASPWPVSIGGLLQVFSQSPKKSHRRHV